MVLLLLPQTISLAFSLQSRYAYTRTRKTFRGGKERNVPRSERRGRIVERDFHTALITRPRTSRGAKCSGRHGMPLHVNRGSSSGRARRARTSTKGYASTGPSLGEESDASDNANAGYFEC